MIKKFWLFFLISALAACTTGRTSVPTLTADQIAQEEQAVYAFLLPEMYHNHGYVIMAFTATDPGGVENTSQILDYVLQNLHDVAPETLTSFKSRNETSQPFSKDMDLGSPYILLTLAEKNQIFWQNQSGWEIFYNRYPNAPGITTLSRVGFNTTLDQALVYIGTQSNWLAGSGYYVLLKKVDGNWSMDQKVMTWIS